MNVKIVNTSKYSLPSYQTANSAGMDLYANIDNSLIIKSLERIIIPTGIFIELPNGFEAQIRPRSGLALKNGVTVLNSPGTIDSDYRGEIKVILINLSNEHFEISAGMRIAQMIIAKYEKIEWTEVKTLSETLRSSGGFGHTNL